MLQKNAGKLLDKHRKNIRKMAEVMFSKSGTDLARMSNADIEKLLFEFQVHQKELELQNKELKQTQLELSLSRDDFARIYNLSPVAYLSLDDQGIIRKANLAAELLLDSSKVALVNARLGKFIHVSDQDKYVLFLNDLVKEKEDQILSVRLEHKNTKGRPQECHGFTLYDCPRSLCVQDNQFSYVELRGTVSANHENSLEICLAIQDVTEYKHNQEIISCLNEKLEQKILEQTAALIESNLDLTRKIEELKHSKHQLWEREAKLNAIFNASIEGIITIDGAGTILSINKAVESIFGYSENELIGWPFNKLMSPAQRKNQDHDLKSYLQTKAPSVIGQILEVEGLHKDGYVIPLDLALVTFSIDGVNYFTGIVRDVSLRKRQEQQEKEHLDELARVARLCLIGEMGTGIAHEVNQPLTAIASYAQACLRFIGVENPDLDQLGDILFKIHQQALRAGQIIHRMKDFVSSRKEERTIININSLVDDAVCLSATDIKHKKINMTLDLAENLPDVTVDRVQIEQVLLNLIRNSSEALIDLPATSQRLLSIQTRMKNLNQVEVVVKDNGPGIDEIHKEKILTPFFTTKPTGMGMGLSISRSIIEAHEGILSFNSKPEAGTTFYFTLPVREKLK